MQLNLFIKFAFWIMHWNRSAAWLEYIKINLFLCSRMWKCENKMRKNLYSITHTHCVCESLRILALEYIHMYRSVKSKISSCVWAGDKGGEKSFTPTGILFPTDSLLWIFVHFTSADIGFSHYSFSWVELNSKNGLNR